MALALLSDNPQRLLSTTEAASSDIIPSGLRKVKEGKHGVVRRCHNAFFPCFGLQIACPCLPYRLTAIKDWLHFMLVVGVFGCVLCLARIIYDVFVVGGCWDDFCYQRIIAIVTLPTMIYFMDMIRQYDEVLAEKKIRKEEEVNDLVDEHNKQIDEIAEQRNKITNHCQVHVSRAFSDKSRDFKKFISKIKAKYALNYVEKEALEELKSLSWLWLVNFSKILVDPSGANSILQGLKRKLHQCKTPQEVCDVVTKRLEKHSVHILIRDTPSKASHPKTRATGNTVSSMEKGGTPIAKCGVSWIRPHRCPRIVVHDQGVLFKLGLCCAQISILSRSHLSLLIAFLIDIPLLVLEASWSRWYTFGLVLFNELCIISTLACFDDVDEIAKLEAQIQDLRNRRDEVANRREEAQRMWAHVQQLNDCWNNWALPTLTFMKTFHEHLEELDDENAPLECRKHFLKSVNSSLAALHETFEKEWNGNTEQWRNEVGKLMNSAEQEVEVEKLQKLLLQLPAIAANLIPAVEPVEQSSAAVLEA